MFEQRLIEKISKLRILKEKRKGKKNIINKTKMIIIKKEAEAVPF